MVMSSGLFMYTLVPPSQVSSIIGLALIGQAVSENMFEYDNYIHVFSPGTGANNPLGPNFFQT